MNGLCSVEDALTAVLGEVRGPASESVPLSEALGRVLAAKVLSDADHPAFPRSRVDGWAVVATDVARPGAVLDVVCEVPAGKAPGDRIGPGQAARVFTGAPVPDGADAVVMQEVCEADPAGRVRVGDTAHAGENVVPRGTECAAGDVVARPGDRIVPGLVGALAAVGVCRPRVHVRPTAFVVSTGDELVPVDEVPGPGRIRNSNAAALRAALDAMGARVLGDARAGDTEAALRDAVDRGLAADVLLVTGGVSVGDYDLVPAVLAAAGVRRVFHGVRVKPGKPLWFGVAPSGTLVFGLPGNPVSALVNTRLFVLPAVWRLLGDPRPPHRTIRVRLAAPAGRGERRRRYVPARMEWEGGVACARPVAFRGSGDVFGFSRADCLVVVPEDAPPADAGAEVDVLLLEGAGC